MFRTDTNATTAQPLPLTRGGALDALRFLAAFCMTIHHFAIDAPRPLGEIHPVFERGYLATDFFIVVSGYVLGRIYGERVVTGRIGVGEFFLLRAGRVVPAHLMVSAAFVLFVLAAGAAGLSPSHPEWFDWGQLPGQVLLIQAWGPFGGKGWNAPAWSLSALLACYLAFPPIWRALRRVRSPALALIMGLLILPVSDALASALTGYTIYQMPMSFGVVRAAPLFFLGVCLAVCSESLYIAPRWAAAVGVASLALFAGVQWAGRYDFLSLSLIALVVLSAGALPARRPSKVLEKAALVSFALFITGELVRVAYFGAAHELAGRLAFGPGVQWGLWGLGLAATVGFAVVFHYLVDWPSQLWIKAHLPGGLAALKARLARAMPSPNPAFDLLGARSRARVREMVLDAGPTPGARRRRAARPRAVIWG